MESFEKRWFQKYGKSIRITADNDLRYKELENWNKNDLKLAESLAAPGQVGLFSKVKIKKGALVGIYRGRLMPMGHYTALHRGKKKYVEYSKKYTIQSCLSRKETCIEMRKYDFCLDQKRVVVMPKYPISKHRNVYLKYNPMVFINEPACRKVKYFTNGQQNVVNIHAFTNYELKTIDYVASRDIKPDHELLVYYGNQYERDDYEVDFDACSVGMNKVFFK
jgi:hypothetical protein